MRDRFPGITSLNNQRVKAMQRQYEQQRASASSPRRPSPPRVILPEERMLAMVQSDKIRKFLVENRVIVNQHIGDLMTGFAAVDANNIKLDDLKTRKTLIEELKLIQTSPRGAFSEFVRSVAGLGVNILYALTRKKAASMATPARVREYEEWKVLWYIIVDPRNKTWKPVSVSSSNLASMAKKDLDLMARQLDIRGRSKMTQRELVTAIEKVLA